MSFLCPRAFSRCRVLSTLCHHTCVNLTMFHLCTHTLSRVNNGSFMKHTGILFPLLPQSPPPLQSLVLHGRVCFCVDLQDSLLTRLFPFCSFHPVLCMESFPRPPFSSSNHSPFSQLIRELIFPFLNKVHAHYQRFNVRKSTFSPGSTAHQPLCPEVASMSSWRDTCFWTLHKQRHHLTAWF